MNTNDGRLLYGQAQPSNDDGPLLNNRATGQRTHTRAAQSSVDREDEARIRDIDLIATYRCSACGADRGVECDRSAGTNGGTWTLNDHAPVWVCSARELAAINANAPVSPSTRAMWDMTYGRPTYIAPATVPARTAPSTSVSAPAPANVRTEAQAVAAQRAEVAALHRDVREYLADRAFVERMSTRVPIHTLW